MSENREKEYKCSVWGKNFESKFEVERHIEMLGFIH